MLAAEPSAHFRRHGWVHLPGFFGPSETASLLAWTDEITGWPETPGAWMRYYERAPDGGWRIAEPFLRVWLDRGETELARGEPRR